ncbi:MAG: hypothetical protein CSA04_01725 [Bacteroidetes bacterium]|nr:MAG: hypothetical protein CSA04_01725 [Bacteroidota bacterium]
MLNINSPFRFGRIVSGTYFYDREEALERITNTLTSGNNVTLYAPRRYGKSSLVHKALGVLEQQGYTCVYVDMMAVYSRETFVQSYAKAIAQKHNNRLKEFVQTVSRLVRGIVPALSFDALGQPSFSLSWVQGMDPQTTLEDLINLPSTLSSAKQKWIVAFDEFQEITKLNGDNFENILRSCIQRHEHVSYLFLGSQTHILKDMFHNKGRAFYHSSVSMTLPKISKEKSVAFLLEKFNGSGLTLHKELAEYIVDTAEGLVYYIQFVAFELWQMHKIAQEDTVTKSSIEQAIDNVLRMKADYYWELWGKQTSYRRKVLEALFYAPTEIYSANTARAFGLNSANTQSAFKYLLQDSIVEKIDNTYLFSDPFLKLFIKKYIVEKSARKY